jgi:hypothetical protein
MKIVRSAAVLVVSIAAVASAQVPNRPPTHPPLPRRMTMQPQGANRLQKITPKQKIAGPAAGQRGAGVPMHRSRKKKNGSK